MELFKSIISWLAYASLGFSISAAYLKINKIWIRKHHAEVEDSVSIVGNVVTIIPLLFFGLNYFFVRQWQGFIDAIIWIVFCIVSIMIGARLWVQDYQKKSFWSRLKTALRLEKEEFGDLAKHLFRPANAEAVLEILAHFAYVDQKLADSERRFIQTFADTWHLDVDWDRHTRLAKLDRPLSLVQTLNTVEGYLHTTPPVEQVSQLIDVLNALVRVDDTVSEQEELILDEVEGLLRNYLDESQVATNYAVVIAPQDADQDVAIATLLPGVEKIRVAGGTGYEVGSYYSRRFADVICEQYRALGFFTIDMELREQAT